jgi:glucosamine--fructose-6-phosphate aminotransferase (isomerizing)
MCGIVGYLGPKDPKSVIVGGLRRLEYRGYDSAGLAVFDQGRIKVVRASGKLSELQKKTDHERFDGHLGIGHTRWATHGVPSERNAHPHSVGGITLVHNGIIENYQHLRSRLAEGGAQFSSDTDSELVAHLIAQKIQQTNDLVRAVELVLPEIDGAYAIVAIWEKRPEEMVAFKSGPPLLLGLGEVGSKKEYIFASDAQAIIEHTNKVVYIEDAEIVQVNGEGWRIWSAGGGRVTRDPVTLNWTADLVEKSGYKHFMLKEIFEQPRAVAASLAPHINLSSRRAEIQVRAATSSAEDSAKKWRETVGRVRSVAIVACGTSHYAGLLGKYLIESAARLPVETDIASEYRYRAPVIGPETLFIVISQSGETADTLAALRLAKQAGAPTLSICNVPRSTIDRESDFQLHMNSGPEIGVASTKALTCTMGLLNLLAVSLGSARGALSFEAEKAWVDALLAAPSQMETVLAYDRFFEQVADRLRAYRGLLYMGRGLSFPIALEGALKLKELAYMHAEGYAAGEMKHGPLALIDERMLVVMLAPRNRHYEKTLSNLEEARARGAAVIAIGTGDDRNLRQISQHYIALPKCDERVSPILEVIPLQLLAYHLADSMGHDVDQPRNLAKSVTVE